MAGTRYVLAVAAVALVAGCTTSQRLESSRGIAVRIVDDIDALEAAIERAEDHCDVHDRHAVLQSVSQLDDNEVLATFDCVESRGGGVALVVDDDDEDLARATREAGDYCDDFDRIAVLQSVGEVDERRVAAFNCVRA
jgi:hypothetical protein